MMDEAALMASIRDILERYGILDNRATEHVFRYRAGIDPFDALALSVELDRVRQDAASAAESLEKRSAELSSLLHQRVSWKRLTTAMKTLKDVERALSDIRRAEPFGLKSREGLLWLVDGVAFFYALAHGVRRPSRGVDEKTGKEYGPFVDLLDDIFELLDLGPSATVRSILLYGATPDGRAIREKWDFQRLYAD